MNGSDQSESEAESSKEANCEQSEESETNQDESNVDKKSTIITFSNQNPLSIDIYSANYFPDFTVQVKNFFIQLYMESDAVKLEVTVLKSKTLTHLTFCCSF